jgi:hypothetical protein
VCVHIRLPVFETFSGPEGGSHLIRLWRDQLTAPLLVRRISATVS